MAFLAGKAQLKVQSRLAKNRWAFFSINSRSLWHSRAISQSPYLRWQSNVWAFAVACCAVCFLTSCNTTTVGNSSPGTTDIDVIDKVKSLDILPRYPTQAGSSTTSAGQRAQPAV